LVCQRRGQQQLLLMAAELSKQFQVPLVAWGAVAAEISSSSSSSSSEEGEQQQPAGRAFCFLPLPAATGLPAHINGYFELSSNRRDVWHGSDMAGAGRLRAQVTH
jgi:sacsin